MILSNELKRIVLVKFRWEGMFWRVQYIQFQYLAQTALLRCCLCFTITVNIPFIYWDRCGLNGLIFSPERHQFGCRLWPNTPVLNNGALSMVNTSGAQRSLLWCVSGECLIQGISKFLVLICGEAIIRPKGLIVPRTH